MQISTLIDQLGYDLNDMDPADPHATWPEHQLASYIEEAVQVIASERPELFAEIRILKVEPCNPVQNTCDCTHVSNVIGQVTEGGRLIKRLRLRKNNDKLIWNGPTCPTNPDQFELKEYYIDSSSDLLWLYPQVPPGKDIWVMIECSVIPDGLDTTASIKPELLAAVKQWVLYRAKMVDGENNTAIVQVAQQHLTAFWQLMRSQKENDDQTKGSNDE